MRSDDEHVGDGASDILKHRKGERKQPRKFRKVVAAVASLLVVSVGLFVTLSEAANPNFVGQWFTLYEESVGSKIVYKIEGKIAKVTATGVKTAQLDIEVRVTNHHPFDVHLISAIFQVKDIRAGHVVLTMSLPDSVIPADDHGTTTIDTSCTGMKLRGLGYRFLVVGMIKWNEIYDTGEVSPEFKKVICEYHSPVEYTKNWIASPVRTERIGTTT